MQSDMSYIKDCRWYKEGQAAANSENRNHPENGCPYGEGSPKYLIWMQGWDDVVNPQEVLEIGYFEHSQALQSEICPVDTKFMWTLPRSQNCLIPQRYRVTIPRSELYHAPQKPIQESHDA